MRTQQGSAPATLANLARRRMRSKLDALAQALTGHFDDHHAFLARMICQHIDPINAMITELDRRIDAEFAPPAGRRWRR